MVIQTLIYKLDLPPKNFCKIYLPLLHITDMLWGLNFVDKHEYDNLFHLQVKEVQKKRFFFKHSRVILMLFC